MASKPCLVVLFFIAVLASIGLAAPQEALVGVVFQADPPLHSLQFMRGLDVAAAYLNNQSSTMVPVRIVPIEIAALGDRNFALEPARTPLAATFSLLHVCC